CSSSRRHTSCSGDWSSDVCSSDLTYQSSSICTTHIAAPPTTKRPALPGFTSPTAHTRTSATGSRDRVAVLDLLDHRTAQRGDERSEERRVGNEVSSRLVSDGACDE